MLDFVFNGMVFDIGIVVAMANIDSVVGNMFFNSQNTLVSSIESMRKIADNDIANIIKAVEDNM